MSPNTSIFQTKSDKWTETRNSEYYFGSWTAIGYKFINSSETSGNRSPGERGRGFSVPLPRMQISRRDSTSVVFHRGR